MDNSTIGIKIADGTYYPVIEGESKKKKKLVLTTVNDDQGSVQIDLYKGAGADLADASYVGSLVIEDIMPAMKGEPEIELVLGVDADGNLNAEAGDAGSNEKQSLSVSLEPLDSSDFEPPNFEIEDDSYSEDSVENIFDDEDVTAADLSDDGFDDIDLGDEGFGDEAVFDEVPSLEDEDSIEAFDEETVFDEVPSLEDEDSLAAFDDSLEDDSFEESGFADVPSFDDDEFKSDAVFEEESLPEQDDDYAESEDEDFPDEYKKKRSPVALVVLIVLILAILGLGAFLIIRGLNGDTIPPLEAEASPVTEPEHAEPLAEEPEIIAEAEPELPAAVEVEEVKDVPAAQTAPEPVPERVTDSDISLADGVPPEGHGGGVWYRLKWGDTLWDLSNSFYRTPWLYGLIAVENGFKNPDIIYAGTDILIPEN